jgi:hypothetical protein
VEGVCEHGYGPSGSVQAGVFLAMGSFGDFLNHLAICGMITVYKVNKRKHFQNLFSL